MSAYADASRLLEDLAAVVGPLDLEVSLVPVGQGRQLRDRADAADQLQHELGGLHDALRDTDQRRADAEQLIVAMRRELGLVCRPDALLQELTEWRQDVADALGLDSTSHLGDQAAGILDAARHAVLVDPDTAEALAAGNDRRAQQDAEAPPASADPPKATTPAASPPSPPDGEDLPAAVGGTEPDGEPPEPASHHAVLGAIRHLSTEAMGYPRINLPAIAQQLGQLPDTGRVPDVLRYQLRQDLDRLVADHEIRPAGTYKRGQLYELVPDEEKPAAAGPPLPGVPEDGLDVATDTPDGQPDPEAEEGSVAAKILDAAGMADSVAREPLRLALEEAGSDRALQRAVMAVGAGSLTRAELWDKGVNSAEAQLAVDRRLLESHGPRWALHRRFRPED